jgi:hypothetical protein
MSLARVYTVKKSRKEFTCGSCGKTIPKGSTVHHYAVGFRGRQQHRCGEHPPSRSDRESSLVAPVWDALDTAEAGLSDCDTAEDFESVLQEAAEVFTEIAGEYEQSEMYDRNEDLQQRAETLNSTASELESTQFDEEPDENDPETWGLEDVKQYGPEQYELAKSQWYDKQREKAQEAIDAAEVP